MVERGLEPLLGDLAGGEVVGDAEVAGDRAVLLADRRDRERDGEPGAVLADVGPLAGLGLAVLGEVHDDVEAGFDAELGRPFGQLGRVVEDRGDAAEHLVRGVAEHALRPAVEERDRAVEARRDDGRLGRAPEDVREVLTALPQCAGGFASSGDVTHDRGEEDVAVGKLELRDRDLGRELRAVVPQPDQLGPVVVHAPVGVVGRPEVVHEFEMDGLVAWGAAP